MIDKSESINNPYEYDVPCNFAIDLGVRLGKLECTVADLDKKGAVREVILNRVEQAFNKSVEVMDGVRDSIIGMQAEIRINTTATNELKNKVDKIESNFKESEEKAKIDLRVIVKEVFSNKLAWILGGGWLAIEILSSWDKISQVFK